ncbi:glycosyltransferase [Subsaxibacter sp. CAU 1640]|uniref:glycosyltransferase family 2 protein n=1 Tax=Subsaxibacter sp. CAU 1640 TaxID=2933271 RepID=UPI002002DD08|nr:glycosyltransferase family 2 protein [Subsaxibacter sp. CAU 1640]MCK7589899.1 glycosyltransferase [Subsaxibacter sp. CAU 1640]
MNDLTVTIILPNYNHSRYLKERLNSIFDQTYQDFEVIILDDASTDNSVELLSIYRNHPKVSYFIVNKVNSGSPFIQWQKGLQLAKGTYVWIAESDDYCDLNFLESQLNFMREQEVPIAVAQTIKVRNGRIYGIAEHPIFRDKDKATFDLKSFFFCPILNVSSTVFDRRLIKTVRTFYNFRIIGDRVFYFEAFFQKFIALNRHTTAYFRKDDGSISKLANKGLDYMLQYFKEHQAFALQALKDGKIDHGLYKAYVSRFFNRINSRLTKRQKLSYKYLILRLKYYR